MDNPPAKKDKVHIFNQMTETHRVIDLAKMVSERTGVSIDYITNPRNEDDTNDLYVKNDRFLHLGLEPTTLEDGLLEEVTDVTRKFSHRCDVTKIPCTSFWNVK